jgi:hypothetical protein
VGSFGYLTVGDMNNYGAAASDNSIPYLKTFLNSIPNIQVNT